MLTKIDGSTSEVYTSNTYDEPRGAYRNVGRLTTSTNPHGSHEYNYNPAGQMAKKSTIVDATAYVSSTDFDKSGAVLAKRTWQHPSVSPSLESLVIDVGTLSSPWGYDLANRLIAIPYLISATTYRANGDTDVITYTNGRSYGDSHRNY